MSHRFPILLRSSLQTRLSEPFMLVRSDGVHWHFDSYLLYDAFYFLQFCNDCLTLFNIFILKEMLSALLSAMSQSRFSQSEGHHLRLLQQEEVLHQQMVGRQCIHTPRGRCMPRYDCRYIFIPLFLSFVIWLQLLLLHRLDFLNGWSKTWRRATVLNWPVQRSWCQEVGVLFDTCGRRSAI